MDISATKTRASSLLALAESLDRNEPDHRAASELLNGTISLAVACYGRQSSQCDGLISCRDEFLRYEHLTQKQAAVIQAVAFPRGFLSTLITEIDLGLVGSIQQQVTGEILADLLGLAKEALSRREGNTVYVAGVLTAAAYEDVLRRMGSLFAGITDRPKLEAVIQTLKEGGYLKGSDVSTASSYLKFRNDALHADWKHVEKPTVHSCLAFVEQLLLRHFS